MPVANITARRPRVFIGDDAQAWHSSSADFAPGFESIAETGIIKTLASLNLLTTLDSPESLSPRANPARWREGDLVRIEIARDDGSWFQWGLLRILSIPSGPNPDGSLTLDLGCWLAWADGPQREGDRSAVAIGAGQNSAAVAARLLEESGIPPAAIDLGTWPEVLAWPLPKEGNGSYVGQAAGLAWANGHRHLYQEPDGVIRAVQWGQTPGTPVAAIVLGQGEVLFQPNPDPVPPAERVVVSGAGFEVVEIPNQTSFSVTVTEPASNYGDQFSGTVTLTTTTINRWGENASYRWTQQEVQQRVPRVLAFVGGVGGLQTTTLREIAEQRYDLTTGLLYQEIFTNRGDVRTFIPDGRSGEATIFGSNALIRETTINYDNDPTTETVTARNETTIEPLYIVAGGDVPGSSPLAPVDARLVGTAWREERPDQWIERTNTRVCAGQSQNGKGGTLKPTALITERPQARESSPPATKRWQPPTTLKERQYEGVALWQHPGGAVQRDRVRPLSSTPAFSNAQCFDLAVAEVQLLEGRRESYLIELPLSDALLWVAPLSTITVDDGSSLWTFKLDLLTWEYFTDSAKLVALGIVVARVPLPVPVGVPLPAFAPGLVSGQAPEPEPPPFVVGGDNGEKTVDVEIVGLPMVMAAVLEYEPPTITVDVAITGQPMTMAAVAQQRSIDVAIAGLPMTMASVVQQRSIDVAITGVPMTMAAVLAQPDPDYSAFVARLTGSYSGAELSEIEAFFVTLKAQGIYSTVDQMALLCAKDNADWVLNMKGTNLTMSNSGATWTSSQGVAGDGISTFVNTNAVLNTLSNYSQNGGYMGIYTRTDSVLDFPDVAARSGTNNTGIFQRLVGGNAVARVNANEFTGSAQVAVANSLGLLIAGRTGSSATKFYKNGALILTDTGTVSAPLLGFAPYIGGRNSAGSAEEFSNRQHAFWIIGGQSGGLSDAQHSALATAVETLLDAFGAGAI